MSIKLQSINKEKVKKVKLSTEEDLRPIKGYDLFPELYTNAFCVASKKKGKTSVLYKIVEKCASKETQVIVFCSTVDKDAVWIAIKDMCEKKGYPFVSHLSIKDDDGADQLNLLVSMLQDKALSEKEPDSDDEVEEEEEEIDFGFRSESDEEEEEEKKKKQKRKSKYRAPEYLIIFDDLSVELKSKSLIRLLKMNRHFKAKIIMSSQYLNDTLPEQRKQIDTWLIFKGQHEKKLLEIHRDCDIGVSFETFARVYQFATKKDFSFLYIDKSQNEFRRNFNKKIILS